MKKQVKLVQVDTSTDLVEALEYLLQEARSGELIGLAYGAILKRRAFFVDAAGEAHRNPMFGLGVANVLACELIQRSRSDGLGGGVNED